MNFQSFPEVAGMFFIVFLSMLALGYQFGISGECSFRINYGKTMAAANRRDMMIV